MCVVETRVAVAAANLNSPRQGTHFIILARGCALSLLVSISGLGFFLVLLAPAFAAFFFSPFICPVRLQRLGWLLLFCDCALQFFSAPPAEKHRTPGRCLSVDHSGSYVTKTSTSFSRTNQPLEPGQKPDSSPGSHLFDNSPSLTRYLPPYHQTTPRPTLPRQSETTIEGGPRRTQRAPTTSYEFNCHCPVNTVTLATFTSTTEYCPQLPGRAFVSQRESRG